MSTPKKVYERPQIVSEKIFEETALWCNKGIKFKTCQCKKSCRVVNKS